MNPGVWENVMATQTTKCRHCGAEWSGRRIQHCTVCHETFAGTDVGDAHRIGEFGVDRRCRTVAEMRQFLTKSGHPRFRPQTNPYGTRVWSGPEMAWNGPKGARQEQEG